MKIRVYGNYAQGIETTFTTFMPSKIGKTFCEFANISCVDLELISQKVSEPIKIERRYYEYFPHLATF